MPSFSTTVELSNSASNDPIAFAEQIQGNFLSFPNQDSLTNYITNFKGRFGYKYLESPQNTGFVLHYLSSSNSLIGANKEFIVTTSSLFSFDSYIQVKSGSQFISGSILEISGSSMTGFSQPEDHVISITPIDRDCQS